MPVDNTQIFLSLEVKEGCLEQCLSTVYKTGAVIERIEKYSHVGPKPHWYIKLFYLRDRKRELKKAVRDIREKRYLLGEPDFSTHK